jgi:hypothetical protein
MNVKMSVALLVIVCTGCGAHSHSTTVATSNGVQAYRASTVTPPAAPVDAVLIEQACYAFSECRTTSSGLGV